MSISGRSAEKGNRSIPRTTPATGASPEGAPDRRSNTSNTISVSPPAIDLAQTNPPGPQRRQVQYIATSASHSWLSQAEPLAVCEYRSSLGTRHVSEISCPVRKW